MIMDVAAEKTRLAKDAARRRRDNTEGVPVGGHSPDPTAPSTARPPSPTVYDGDRTIAVQDNHLRTHASGPGVGMVCPAVRDGVGWYTLTWSHDLGLVDCLDCLTELARRATGEAA